jgi:signal transduction histidine kinase
LTAVGAVYMGVVIYSTRVYQQEMIQRLHHSLAANLATQPIPVEEEKLDPSMLAQWFHIFTVANPSIELYLLDREGRIVGHTSDPEQIERTQVSLEPIQHFLAGSETLPILGDDPRGAERRKVFSVAAILVGGEVKGYLYAILGGEYYASVMQLLQRSQVLRLSVALVAICSLLGLGAGMLAFRLLTSRLRRLSTAIAEFEETGHAPRLGHGRFAGDELDRLETAFDGLADRISEQVTLLEKSDTVRRELIAGVSHDLRTPLTTLRGYLETLLLMEGGLSEAERREYLASALKHGQRLSELIRSLSELARLDAPEMQAQLEPFPLGEIVQDVVQKFELAASDQGIELRAEYAPDLPPVYADIGLIERVFENLIENALRYTPEGGTISVALAHEAHAIRVSVTDSGPGIPPALLPRIFDRFWRSQEGAQRRSEGMGLVLAIAKRILELHGSSIEAESKLGVGTSFSFKLPTRPGISGARDETFQVS